MVELNLREYVEFLWLRKSGVLGGEMLFEEEWPGHKPKWVQLEQRGDWPGWSGKALENEEE